MFTDLILFIIRWRTAIRLTHSVIRCSPEFRTVFLREMAVPFEPGSQSRPIRRRRRFVRDLGLASAALGVTAALPARAQTATLAEIDVLNYLLNLEYLKAELYTIVSSARTIDQFGIAIDSGQGRVGVTSGGGVVLFDPANPTVKRLTQELADADRTHVVELQKVITALGGSPVNKPAINLDALEFGFRDQTEFLQLARALGDLVVSAYLDAFHRVESKTALHLAGAHLAAEAQQAGAIRTLLTGSGASSRGVVDDLDVPTPSTSVPVGTRYLAAGADAAPFARTPGQVLQVLYGAGGAVAGGFFPYGTNGTLIESDGAAAVNKLAVLTADPNPIALADANQYGATTVTWSAPGVKYIQIRVNAPAGPLFTTNYPGGSLRTASWVNDGMILYLQDISDGKPLIAANTLATLILRTYAA